MRVLVTGGAGFIGSGLVGRLLDAGESVVVVDDLSTGRLENLAPWQGQPQLETFVGSASDPKLMEGLCRQVDEVVHLAAAVGVRLVMDNPVRAMEGNLLTQTTVFRAAAAANCRLLFASSSEVYGPSAEVPFREDDHLTMGATRVGRWSYAASKLSGEWQALGLHEKDGLKVTICRLFNTVGPGQRGRFGMVLPNLVRQAQAGEDITVFGDGQQTRCFAHVDDTVEALCRLRRCDRAIGEVVNIGSDREVSILELAKLVKSESKSSSQICLIPYSEAYGPEFEDMHRRVPALEKLKALTGFEAKIPLKTIVQDTLKAKLLYGVRLNSPG
ncbi:MAG: NAD-dependent epimerase/dehydratase family protein [Planctomycetota bacterium]